MTNTERFHWRLTLVLWCILFGVSMYLMLYTAMHKTILIADADYGQGSLTESMAGQGGKLLLQQSSAEENTFYIPLGKGGKPENVVVENCYTEGELRVYIRDAETDFYENQMVKGDIARIVSAAWESQSSGVLLRLKMNDIYEFQNRMEGENLKIAVHAPHDIYQMVVVIDPAGGGSETGVAAGGMTEKEIVLSVSKLLQPQMKSGKIRIYLTRSEDKKVSPEERTALAEAVGADIFINIGVGTDEDSEKYGIRGCYNEAYFIPDFGNVQLADLLTRNVTVACKNRAVGLAAADQESILQQFGVPAARIELGYLSNAKERELLAQEEYRQKLAEGIAKSIEEVYTAYYE